MIHTTPHPFSFRINLIARLSLISLLTASFLITPFTTSVSADTAPPAGTPATVSADALPTVQTDGVVWASATFGDKVYVTGKFTTATDIDGSTHARSNLLAFNINTGALDRNFNHSLSGATTGNCWSTTQTGSQGCAIAVSPDGTKLFIGGSFAAIDGQARANSAAIDLTTNSVLSGFAGANSTVRTIDASNTQAFIGGAFSSVGGVARSRVAAFNANGMLNTTWVANVTGVNTDGSVANSAVFGVAVAQSSGNLIIAGSFNRINGAAYNSLGAVKLATGAVVAPWASKSDSTFPIRMQGANGPEGRLAYTSVSVSGTQAYLTAFTYSIRYPGSFEGRAAVNTTNGNLVWMQDCHGDTYDAQAIGQVVYSVSHAHNCTPIGGFPEQGSVAQRRAMADTTFASGTNSGRIGTAPDYTGKPKALLLNWFPDIATGSYTGQSQGAWTVTGNADYVVLGGEFPRINGVSQRGLVRFGVAPKAPNKIGPTTNSYRSGYAVMSYAADATGTARMWVSSTSDADNGLLTYEVYRKNGNKLVASKVIDSRFWRHNVAGFTDTGVPQGTSLDYYVVVKDAFGNTLNVPNSSVFNNTDPRIVYSGTWSQASARADTTADFNRDLRYNTTAGSSYTFTFYGSNIKLIGERAYNRGTFSVSVDGAAATSHTAYGEGVAFQQTLYEKTGLGFGRHTIKVTNTQAGKYQDLDAIYVNQDKVLDSTSSAIAYTGTWATRQNGLNNYGGGIRYTAVKGAKATTTFNGTSVAVMTEKGPGRGTYTISVDGGTPINCNAYATKVAYQQITCQASGLAPGNHTLVITNTSTVSGRYLDVDAVFSR